MVEKEAIKNINYEDVEKLWKSNHFYNVNYSDLNIAIISDEKTFTESITDLLGSDTIISGFKNFFQKIKCIDETNERHFFQWVSKYLIPLTLMNPESENYVQIYNSFWEESKSHCYTTEEEVVNKSKFIMYLFTFCYLSNMLFKSIVPYEYENMKQFFPDYSEANCSFKIFYFLLDKLNKDLPLLYHAQEYSEKELFIKIYDCNRLIHYLRIVPEIEDHDNNIDNNNPFNTTSLFGTTSNTSNLFSFQPFGSTSSKLTNLADLDRITSFKYDKESKLNFKDMKIEIPEKLNLAKAIIESYLDCDFVDELKNYNNQFNFPNTSFGNYNFDFNTTNSSNTFGFTNATTFPNLFTRSHGGAQRTSTLSSTFQFN